MESFSGRLCMLCVFVVFEALSMIYPVLLRLAPFLSLGALVALGITGVAFVSFVGVALLGVGGGIVRIVWRFLRGTTHSNGNERFIDQHATVIVALTPSGRVRFHGENWAARLDDPFAAEHLPVGTDVRIIGIHELQLIVTPSVEALVGRVQMHALPDPHTPIS